MANNKIRATIRLFGAMYDLPYHKESDEQVIRQFMIDHPLAFITGCDEKGRPVATQAPVLLEERDGRQFLAGHLMKNTDHHRALVANSNVLVVFAGHHVYVSGSWYSNPHTPSTWNYMSVHARGTVRFLDGAGLERVLRRTSLHFEDADEASPTAFDNLPRQLTDRLVDAIVAFEIEVDSLDTVFKLSQDRDLVSYRTIMARLREKGESGRVIAAEMEKRESALFQGRAEA